MNSFGSAVYRFHSLASTNDLARELAMEDAPEGTIVIAARQTAGRGRQGREWSSPLSEGLYLSVVLRPSITAAEATVITLAAAVAVHETLLAGYGLKCDIKWPNDVMAADRKICGILIESASEGNHLRYAILGIGINLLQKNFPEELEQTATSLFIETGRQITSEEILSALLTHLEDEYKSAINVPARVLERWAERSSYAQGARVRISFGDRALCGITRGLTASGALVLETDEGSREIITAGEISLRRAEGNRG